MRVRDETGSAPTKEDGYMDLHSDFKLGMRRLASGVSIVATSDEQGPKGFLATSVSSVALDPWPCLLVCVNKSASSHDAFIRTQVFSVNVLAERQVDIARRFSSPESRDARFEASLWEILETGAPIYRDALASFDCRLMTTMTVQTHTVLIGRAAAVRRADTAEEPLIYYDGCFDRSRAA
jgi:flavin reductase